MHLLCCRLITLSFIIIFSAVFSACFPVEAADTSWQGRVVKVLDGDSLRVTRENTIDEVRLYGIDTPEYKQPWSNKAKQFSKAFVAGKRVTVVAKDRDHYGRVVALVRVDGELLNGALVEEGLAWVYTRYCKEKELCNNLKLLQKRAQGSGRGLWRDKNAVPPWQWKRNNRK